MSFWVLLNKDDVSTWVEHHSGLSDSGREDLAAAQFTCACSSGALYRGYSSCLSRHHCWPLFLLGCWKSHDMTHVSNEKQKKIHHDFSDNPIDLVVLGRMRSLVISKIFSLRSRRMTRSHQYPEVLLQFPEKSVNNPNAGFDHQSQAVGKQRSLEQCGRSLVKCFCWDKSQLWEPKYSPRTRN